MSEEKAYEREGRPAALDMEVICCVQDWVGWEQSVELKLKIFELMVTETRGREYRRYVMSDCVQVVRAIP